LRVLLRPDVLFLVALTFIVIHVLLAARYGVDARSEYVLEDTNALAWAVGGLVATRLRPGNRIGVLMLRLAVILAVNVTSGDHLSDRSGLVRVVVTVAMVATPVQWAAGIHVALAFPSGRVPEGVAARLVRMAYVWSVFGPVMYLIGAVPNSCASCATGFGLNLLPPAVDIAVERVDVSVFIVFLIAAVAVLGRRVVRASPRQRRVLAYPSAGLGVAACFAVVLLLLVLWQPVERPFVTAVFVGLEVAAGAVIPAGFLFGLLRERLDEARVADLVARLATTPVASLDAALSRTLGDPGARLVFAAGTEFVDHDARPIEPGPHVLLTPVGDPAAPSAFLMHDRSLSSQPDLLASVSAAAALALDNDRLRAELLAQLAEIRASRERIVEAGDTARRRLERDLHDGAQQRLISLGLSLRLIRQRLGDIELLEVDEETLALMDQTEAQTRAAIRELRELARGIHPTILTEQGLAAALEQLTARCPVPVRVEVDPLPALPPSAEATAYYIASEALTNIAKHAGACTAWLRVTVSGNGVDVQVGDDGPGGALPMPGSGLAGLADRVAAVGGTLTVESSPGRGTRIDAHIPGAAQVNAADADRPVPR
jgi:signal transduction histidine kinase